MNSSPNHERSDRPHWLCVAYAFPPINRSGTYRTVGFVNHLDRLGWEATVLTVQPHGEPLDAQTLLDVPASTRVIRTPWENIIERIKRIGDAATSHARVARLLRGGMNKSQAGSCLRAPWPPPQSTIGNPQPSLLHRPSLREWVSQLLITPDSRTGWISPAVRAGLKAIRRHRPDVIYSTSPFASAHLIALILSRSGNLPWVADFRDPWSGNPFRRLDQAGLKKWDGWLERQVIRGATRVICASPSMTQQVARRYPWATAKCKTILNGFDRNGHAELRPIRLLPKEAFVLTHCGQFYGPRSPLVWFAALGRALRQSPQRAGRIHFVFIGPESFQGRSLKDWAADAGVGDRVHVMGCQSRRRSLGYMAGSDALMLAGTDGGGGELQIPGKLFEYLTMRKPIITTCCPHSPIVDILHESRAEAIVCDPGDESALARAMVQTAAGDRQKKEDAWEGVDRFDRAHRAAELVELFEQCTRTSRGSR